MSYPTDFKYTKEHEWIKPDGGNATIESGGGILLDGQGYPLGQGPGTGSAAR